MAEIFYISVKFLKREGQEKARQLLLAGRYKWVSIMRGQNSAARWQARQFKFDLVGLTLTG
jgi:hypothetical protein